MSLELDATVAVAGTVTDDGRPAAPAPGLRIGSMLAHFRVDGLLGKGGMGEVYRATDLALDRPVALKTVAATVAQDPARRERLFREARAQARLQHPNVCHIYYVGEQDGVLFFAMELVAGESLAERVARGPVPVVEAIELVRQAALGLREAQRHGFTHRDVKPSNLMCDREGRVKVVDFGLVTRGRVLPLDVTAASSTETGAVGTPLYMAPEQATGEADLRADIYALGATLHHLVCGQPPFAGASLDELVTQHRSEPRPKLQAPGVRPRVLSALDAVIARMMAKAPEDRFASYDELIAELDRVSAARTRPAGFFVRALAAGLDLLVVSAALGIATGILSLFDRELPENGWLVVLGALYGIVAISRWGTTFGRWLLDLEVTSVTTSERPSLGAAAVRHAMEYGLVSVAMVLSQVHEHTGGTALEIVWLLLGGAGIAWPIFELTKAALMSPDKRTRWDRAAQTMVRYRARPPA
jgi:hypothetical protein